MGLLTYGRILVTVEHYLSYADILLHHHTIEKTYLLRKSYILNVCKKWHVNLAERREKENLLSVMSSALEAAC